MKVEVNKIDAVKRELKFIVPKERFTKKLDEIYVEISKASKIKGFRPGMAPRHVLESHHGKFAKEETIRKLIPEVYTEALDQEKITPINVPEICDVKFQDGILFFSAKLDIKPEVKITDYKGIPLKRKNSSVPDEEVNKALEFIQKGQGKENEAFDDTFARGLGYPNLAEFKRSLTRRMEMEKEEQNRLDVENQVAEYLIKNSSFVVPESLLTKQLEHRLENRIEHFKHNRMPQEDIDRKISDWREELKPFVEKEVRVYLIFDRIAALENIALNKGENLSAKVMPFLLKEAKWEEVY